MNRHSLRRALRAPAVAILFLPLSAYSISTGGVSGLPVDNLWALIALVTAFIVIAHFALRRHHKALSLSLLGAVLVAGIAWQSPDLRAQIIAFFTDPNGETLPIPVTQIPDGGNIAGFEMADYTNNSGAPLRITGIVPPDFDQCFPGGNVEDLLPAGPADPSPPTPCTQGMILEDGQTCRVNVDELCRDEAASAEAIITALPGTLVFMADDTGVITVSNDAGSPVAATNISASIPGGSNLSVQSTTCAANLPAGGSCTITLTSAVAESFTNVTIEGDNTNAVDISVTVLPLAPPTLSYAGSPYTFTQNEAISPAITPSVAVSVDSYSINPTLPTGITFDTNTGAIGGTPTVTSVASNYTVTATNAAGSTIRVISIAVINDIACDGSMVGGFCWHLGTNGQSCDTVCTGRGGNVPAGTTDYSGSGGSDVNCGNVMTALNADTGAPSNPTPVTTQANALGCASDYTGVAFTFRGTTATTAAATGTNIRRACACDDQPAPTGVDYINAPFTFTQGIAIATQTPTVTNVVADWSITPTLPTGLSFDTSTGEISGTPTALQTATNHTVTATNAGGSDAVVISVTVQQQAPADLVYAGSPYTFTQNTAISPAITPTVTGSVDSYGISPGLPTGMTFDTNTGAIGGTPTVLSAASNYTITATNGTGSDNVVISIAVTSDFACDGSVVGGFCWYIGTNGQSCDAVCTGRGGNVPAGTTDFAGSGGSDANCGDVMTALESDTGHPFNPTPVVTQANALGCASDYTGVAFTFRGTTATTAAATGGNIRRACACDEQPAPTGLDYTNAPFTFSQGVAITPQTPAVTNVVTDWSIAPALPTGLSFDTTTGEISGTPTALQTATNHTVTATNAGGSDAVVISVTVEQQAPADLAYAGSPFTFTQNTAISPAVTPTVTGFVDSYSINPALPTGMSFDTNTGAIDGTPTVTSAATNYTVTATNGTGSDNVVINITVSAPLSCSSGGVVVGGFCWYIGTNGQSCDTVCTGRGGNLAAGTTNFAGSGGSNANCESVMVALEAENGHPFNPSPVTTQANTLGCASDYSDVAFTFRGTSATDASATGGSIRRACACDG